KHFTTATQRFDAVLPLSASQRDIYLGSLLAPESAQHSEGFSFHIRQPLNIDLWRQALQYLAQQHYIMRGRLLLGNLPYMDIAYQGFDSDYQVNLQELDWRGRFANNEHEQLISACNDLVYRHYGDLRD